MDTRYFGGGLTAVNEIQADRGRASEPAAEDAYYTQNMPADGRVQHRRDEEFRLALASHLADYEPLVSSLATQTTAYGRPVLLLNGDSHVYRSDNPLQKVSSCTGDEDVCPYDAWDSHPSYDVPNFHRIVVHGSTVPLEYLRLTANRQSQPTTATSFGPFSWQRVTQ